MSVTAKCVNYTGCLLAYRGEEIKLEAGAPLVCPECGKPVKVVQGAAGAVVKWALLGLLVLGLAGGAVAALLVFKDKLVLKGATPTPSPAPSTVAPTPIRPNKEKVDKPERPSNSTSTSTPAPPKPAATPVVPVLKVDPPKVVDQNTSLQDEANKRVRDDVLRRIDYMPNVSAQNKDKLYNSVQRARGMGMVLQIPFGSGKVDLSANEVVALKAAVEDPRIMKLRDDPTAVFVVLGYADSKGDDQKNLAVSQKRADSVVIAMRDKCGVANVTHAVAMGGSTMHDAQSLDKNRIVEVWAVLP